MPALQWPVAVGLIFLSSVLLLTVIFRPLVNRTKHSGGLAWAGAACNGIVALIMMLAFLWSIGLLLGLSSAPNVHIIAQRLGYYASSPLVVASQWLMSRFIGIGLHLVGAGDSQIHAGIVLAQMPADGIKKIQSVAASSETKSLLHNEDIQIVLASGNLALLSQHPDFIAFAQQPGMDAILQLMPRSADQSADQALASSVTTVWQRIDNIKHSTKVQQALADPEVQSILQTGDPTKLMIHPKMQPIIAEILANVGSEVTVQRPPEQAGAGKFAQMTNPKELPESQEKAQESFNNAMFRWQSADGKTHFSTWDRVPKEHREGAELINL
jgi:hypothetical protein